MSSYNNRAMLASLNIQQWSGRKLDRKVTREVITNKAATGDSGRFNKNLLPNCKVLKDIARHSTAMRSDFYRHTLPWQDKGGIRLLPTDTYMAYVSLYNRDKREWDMMVNSFLSNYEWYVNESISKLGRMYSSADYPSVDSIRRKFGVSFDVDPVPSVDFRVQIADDEAENIRKDVEQRNMAAFTNAMNDAWNQLHDKVKNLRDRLSDDEAIFRDSLVGNIKDTCNMLQSLNFANDPNLELMRIEVRDNLAQLHPETLRHNKTVRRNAVASSDAIMKRMSAFMGDNTI